jgi:hypothetical protein
VLFKERILSQQLQQEKPAKQKTEAVFAAISIAFSIASGCLLLPPEFYVSGCF